MWVYFGTHSFFPVASEYRSWLLFDSIPILNGILDECYLAHFMLFSKALWLLLQSSITMEDINLAEQLLQKFCSQFASLYGKLDFVITMCLNTRTIELVGERYYTANIHQLLHMPDCVHNLGPLWAHSSFPFKNTNGWLQDLFHGLSDPKKQVQLIALIPIDPASNPLTHSEPGGGKNLILIGRGYRSNVKACQVMIFML